MKKLLLLTLITLSSQAFANIQQAPVKVCVYNDLAAYVNGYEMTINMELSYPGESGVWSGYIKSGSHTCMHPYDWKGAPSIMDVYAVSHTGQWGVNAFYQCSPGMTTNGGMTKAPEQEIDYSIDIASSRHYDCNRMT